MNDVTELFFLIGGLGFVTLVVNIQAIRLRWRVEALEEAQNDD